MPQAKNFGRQSDEYEARLRPMVAEDLDALVALWIVSWRDAMPEIDFEARRDWITMVLLHPTYRAFVAESEAGPAGFVVLEGRHMHQLVVAETEKGSGVATRLLDLAKAAAGAGLTLDVNQANARAVRFYEREGFSRTGAGRNVTSGLSTWAMRWTPP